MRIADHTADPSLQLLALDAALAVDGSDELLERARLTTDRISEALPDDGLRFSFAESDLVQRIRR